METKTIAILATDGTIASEMTFAEFADSIGVDINNLPAAEDAAVLRSLKARIVEYGLTPSAGCWEDERLAYAFSAESTPGCLNHPLAEVSYNKETHTLRVTGRPHKP